MVDLTRADRAQVVTDATALQDQARALLTARQATRDAGDEARHHLEKRAVPLLLPAAHDLVPSGEGTPAAVDGIHGRLLPLLPRDADLFHAELAAQQLEALPPPFDSWLEQLVGYIPEAIPLATPQGLFRRLLGRAPDAEARDRATSGLMAHLEFAGTPQTQRDLARARPVDNAGSALDPDHLRQATAAALGTDGSGIMVLPTHELRDITIALLTSAEAAREGAVLEDGARAAAETVVDGSAQALLADIDMDHFRTRVSVGRFPSKALERAGILSVADLAGWHAARLAALDGIGSDTAHTLAIAAQQVQGHAREQAKIDLAAEIPDAANLRCALKALLDHRLRERGATADRQLSLRMEAFARRVAEATQHGTWTTPYSSEAGHAPALLIGKNGSQGRALQDSLRSFVQRQEARNAGLHLDAEQCARLAAGVDEDFTARPSDYFALLTELGYEDRLAQNTHGDLPERLIRLVESVELDTELLTLESLRRYQHFAARFIVRQRKVIIGDEMGLGKTIEALAAIAHLTRRGQSHTLVVCPAAVVANWIREIESKSSIAAHRLHGAERDTAASHWQRHGGVAVTTFETLGRLLRSGEFDRLDTVVVDEAHKIKNPEARRTRNSVAQLERASHAILMTGTPIENRLEEFRTLLSYLDPSLARSSEGLLPVAFRQHIAPAYLRRNQEDVLKELPELNEIADWIEFSSEDQRAYEAQVAAGNFMGMRRAAMEAGTRSNKVERLQEIVDDAKANSRKVIVFSFFRTVIDSLSELLPGTVHGPISGAVSAGRRQEIIDEFSSAPGGGVLISQIQAGGEGLNIQAASVVVICEPQLKPSLEVQAIARAYRMGQQRSVQVHRLLSDEGVDPRVVELLGEKTKVFDEYARESATKDSDLDAVETGDVAIAKRLVAEEQARVLGAGSATVAAVRG
ncbi:helicase SNF2 [Brachybacterium avium]|uniref:Helicase SNF2 n=1 Tax=Brachybacterium avium TaxID=2017485 RepID=A0A220UDA3_9MICO|nr:DEAD/DEAH box helicase [Brachybacterium avium]ASK66194.1 helicase SNF2 [Brachybacterium avium]